MQQLIKLSAARALLLEISYLILANNLRTYNSIKTNFPIRERERQP